jgi:hypothetical protein
MTHSAELKARGLAAALQYLKEWEGPEFTIADALELYVVDEEELFLREDMYECEVCHTLHAERLRADMCDECHREADYDTRQPGVYGHASGRTL